MEGGGGGARSLVPGGPVLLVLCGLLEASGGGRALPQLSDDIPFRVNWPGTEFSLIESYWTYEVCHGKHIRQYHEEKESGQGVGWWKYEFCYGKHVHQYHEDKDSGKTSVVVGTWNQEEHIEWAKKNTARAYHLQDDGTQTVRAQPLDLI
ncbi:hypothetical protein CB1_000157003 [Camelus ferus]|nr:hypothetical protein CB1_000157003 [Camelus ferus]